MERNEVNEIVKMKTWKRKWKTKHLSFVKIKMHNSFAVSTTKMSNAENNWWNEWKKNETRTEINEKRKKKLKATWQLKIEWNKYEPTVGSDRETEKNNRRYSRCVWPNTTHENVNCV